MTCDIVCNVCVNIFVKLVLGLFHIIVVCLGKVLCMSYLSLGVQLLGCRRRDREHVRWGPLLAGWARWLDK